MTIFEQLEQFLKSDVFLAFAAMAALMALVFWVLNHTRPEPVKPVRFSDKPWLNAFFWIGVLVLPMLAVLFFEVLWLLFKVVAVASDQVAQAETPQEKLDTRWTALTIVGLLTALGGLLGTPLAFIRVHTTERQTVAQEEGLVTDRINKAVENLGATRVVKVPQLPPRESYAHDPLLLEKQFLKDVNAGAKDMVFVDSHEPNLEVRIGAIYALERIARDNLDYHVQIMEILTAYVRENAKVGGARKSPREIYEEERNDGATRCDADDRATQGRSIDEAQADWLGSLPPLRTDIQTTLSVIGRRTDIQKETEMPTIASDGAEYRLDLRDTNLQKADLSNLDFSSTVFAGSRLDGAQLRKTELRNSSLRGARLSGVGALGADLAGSDMVNVRAFGANFASAVLHSARIGGGQFGGSSFSQVEFQEVHFAMATGNFGPLGIRRTAIVDLVSADFDDADLEFADFRGVDLLLGSYRRANLMGAKIDDQTRFDWCDISGACVVGIDFSDVNAPTELFDETFGDASTSIPANFQRPAHWPGAKLTLSDYHEEWRRWKSDPDAYIRPEDRSD